MLRNGAIKMPGKFRYDARRDKSEPEIVKALRAAGYDVYRDLPVDLAIRRSYWEPGAFLLMECKTPQKRGAARKRKDQDKQQAVLRACGIPKVTTPAQAVEAARAVHHDND